MGEKSFPPPGPLSCTTRGGAQSETVGQSEFRPSPGTPPLGMPHHAPDKGRKYYMSKAIPGVGGGRSLAGPLFPTHDKPANGSPGTPPLRRYCTHDRGRAGVVFIDTPPPPPPPVIRSP